MFCLSLSWCKKVLIYTSVTILILVFVSAIVIMKSLVHVKLPHGAMLHVLPALDNKIHGAIIICPGGGYSYLEKWVEGYYWFPFFYLRGYVPAMLEYRMPMQDYYRPMTDGTEAILMMRKRAKEWHFDEKNVGFVGFSAGGHLASTMMVIANDSVRPDFGILFYPVISMKKDLTHIDSHNQLLGKDATRQLEDLFSNELHVSEKTPPAFIAVASDDKCVSAQNSILFKDAMNAKNRCADLHIYPSGGHGFVCHRRSEYRVQALDDLSNWLSNRNQK